MLAPVRCFTCGKVLPSTAFKELLLDGLEEQAIFEKLGVKRYCCRGILKTTSGEVDDRILDATQAAEEATQRAGQRFTFAEPTKESRMYLAR